MKRLIALAKRLPIDVGQRTSRFVTQGKVIARDLVPPAAVGARALDVGCRDGEQTRWLERAGYAVTSIDVEPAFSAAERVDANRPLPYPDASFQLVWCSEVIEHLLDPERSANELRRVLAPGGTLLLTTPNSHAWFLKPFYALGVPAAALQNPDHRHFFHYRDVRVLFPSAEISGFFPYALVKRTIRSPVALALLTPTFVIRETKP